MRNWLLGTRLSARNSGDAGAALLGAAALTQSRATTEVVGELRLQIQRLIDLAAITNEEGNKRGFSREPLLRFADNVDSVACAPAYPPSGGNAVLLATDMDLNVGHSEHASVAAARPALRWLLRTHALVTAAAGAVLVVAPGAIPSVVGIRLQAGAELLCYLLAGAEFGFAALSWYGAAAGEPRTVRGVVLACLVLHATSAALEVLALARGADARLWYNVAARIVIIGAFGAFARPRHRDAG